jgi:uncharacterized protein (DUF58 family)
MIAAPFVTTRAFAAKERIDAAVQSASAAELSSRMPTLIGKAREIAASVIHGVHGRRRAGQGETFWQFRPFSVGEAAQRIDWRRSARGDHLYVREREWEAAHSYFLWLDCSPSMAFVSSLAHEAKMDRAIVLGLALADVLVRGGERAALYGLTKTISARDVIERLALALVESADDVARREFPPHAPFPPRAKIVLISDFLCDPLELSERLRDYAAAGATGALLMVADPAEESFPFSGETRFLDTDSDASFHAGRAETFRKTYEERLARHRDEVYLAAKSAGFSLQLHRTDRSAAEALLALTMGLYARSEPI